METTLPAIGLIVTLLLFTTFVKTATVLSICRYGLGLLGFEFGAVCLVVSVGLSLFMCPPELTALGFPDALFSRSANIQPQAVTEALIPFMERRVDPGISKYFAPVAADSSLEEADKPKDPSVAATTLRSLAPAYILSELKSAFQLGCMLLIPFVLIDLLVAHILALVGVQQLAAHTVSLPLKILVFVVAGGWGLLGSKLLGF
jgi:flagellar biosynthesis protein FliP